MLKIQKNGDVKMVTKGAFENQYKALGYQIMKDEKREVVKEAKIEDKPQTRDENSNKNVNKSDKE